MNNKLSRRQVREKAVQTLFQLVNPLAETDPQTALEFAMMAGNDPEAGFDPEIKDTYLNQLVTGVSEHQEKLDHEIARYLTNEWTLDRIAKIDLTILRVAFYEVLMVSEEQVPAKVAVNEAIELSKLFSDEKSRQFVSGVLAQLLKAQA
ncbi:transcription antitermination factor NusB [Vaginisenegalia massiliensis]|uniref:transcription antitermination factor NusB n=1 Tax=Vaginisenegalia massiliensis TaxID=2058294 RepID=UPI001F14F3D2|nr:transcription antitermination factor NusB [Vaginisenegalia massiliensis]